MNSVGKEQYYAVGVFSEHWKKGEMPIERKLIKGASNLFLYLNDGTDSITDLHGKEKRMWEGLELRVVRIEKEYYDQHKDTHMEHGEWSSIH